jgi:hypothetical protein
MKNPFPRWKRIGHAQAAVRRAWLGHVWLRWRRQSDSGTKQASKRPVCKSMTKRRALAYMPICGLADHRCTPKQFFYRSQYSKYRAQKQGHFLDNESAAAILKT